MNFVRPASILFTAIFMVSFLPAVVRGDDWPQWLGPQRDGVWREKRIVDKFPDGGPKLRWRIPISAGYSGPAVANGYVYVTDRVLQPGAANPQNSFDRNKIPGVERILCLKEADGTIVWKDEYPSAYSVSYAAGPRATPVVSEGKVYTLGAEGDIRCYEAISGKILWERRLVADGADTPMWGYAASPLVDGDKLICTGSKDAIAIAFNKNTGDILWRSLSAKEPGYCPPMIYKSGGKRQLIIWYPDALASLDPETGRIYWEDKREVKMGLTIPTPRMMGDMLFVASAYEGSLMMSLDPAKPGAQRSWMRDGRNERNPEALNCLMSTPFLKDGYIYGICLYGQLRCIKADTGQVVWETIAPTTDGQPTRWANAFIIAHEDRYFLANEKGDLIIAKLTPQGYEEIGRSHLIDPVNMDAQRPVVWSHPAFANRSVYLRNDKEIACFSLAAE